MAQQLNQYNSEALYLGINIIASTGTATVTAKKGTLLIKTDAATTGERLWINTDGATTWAYFTTSA